MKHVALSLLAAACGALSASALDATNARIWLDDKIQPDFASIGSGIASEKYGTAPTYARNWQYVSIPVHVEGVSKEDRHPHFIPELTVRVSLVVSTSDAKGKTKDSPELLSKEITYVDIPLVKGKKGNVGEGVVNVGVFVSPSGAFNLAEKDGNLTKKLIAVAVEGTFKGSSCNRVKEKANDGVATAVVVNTKEGRGLSEGWWNKSGGGNSGSSLVSIAETPFAHEYARLGFPAIKSLYGGAAAPAPVAPAAVAPTPGEAGVDTTTGGYGPTTAEDTADGTSTTDEETSKTKKGKKSKKSRR